MKSVIVRAIAAVLLLGAAWVCWTAGQLQARLTEANRQVLMLRYAGSLGEYEDIEQSLGYVGRLPPTATGILIDLHERHATAQYWDNLYGTLSLARDASGDPIEKDPDVLFLAANAAYRAGQRADGDQLATVLNLEAVVSDYAEVLKKSPGHVDAAYNYEYAVRARDAAARSRETPRVKPGGPSTPPAAGQNSAAGGRAAGTDDLPKGPTIHGHPGGPPSDTDMKKFKVLAPMRPDEREATPDKAGANKRPLRRG
jgi:hypothetical protein